MPDKSRKRDNNGLEQSDQEASTEKRRRTEEQLQQQQPQVSDRNLFLDFKHG